MVLLRAFPLAALLLIVLIAGCTNQGTQAPQAGQTGQIVGDNQAENILDNGIGQLADDLSTEDFDSQLLGEQ